MGHSPSPAQMYLNRLGSLQVSGWFHPQGNQNMIAVMDAPQNLGQILAEKGIIADAAAVTIHNNTASLEVSAINLPALRALTLQTRELDPGTLFVGG